MTGYTGHNRTMGNSGHNITGRFRVWNMGVIIIAYGVAYSFYYSFYTSRIILSYNNPIGVVVGGGFLAPVTNFDDDKNDAVSGPLPLPPPPPPPCLVFLHIPKVGGRTLTNFLGEVANTMGFNTTTLYREKRVPAGSLSSDKKFYVGHFTSMFFDRFPDTVRCHAVTMLREPVDRAISAFFFHKHKYPRDVVPCLVEKKCWLNWQYSNDNTRRLAGLPETGWVTLLEDSFYSIPPNRTWLDYAKRNLATRIDTVCFLQDLQSCVRKILRAFSLDVNQNHTITDLANKSLAMFEGQNRSNNKYRTRKRKTINNETMELFQRANDIDIELYEWAVQQYYF